MASSRLVGPDLPSGLRRPGRSVSLRDPREQPVQMMGLGQGGAPGKFGGGYGVHTRISELDGEYRVRLFIDGEYQAGADYFADDIEEATETAKAMEEDAHLTDKTSDVARGEARDFVEDAIMRPDLDEVVVPEDLVADDARLPVEEMRGLTADEAFQQHQATSGAGAMGGLPVNRMAFNFDEFDRLITGGVSEAEQNPWDLVEDPVTGELVERTSTGYMPYLGGEDNWEGRYDQSLVGLSGAELDEEIAEMEEWVGEENTSIAQGYRDRALAEKARREGGQPAGAEGVAEMQGLTADEAFQQHHAARRINPNQGELPGTGGPAEEIRKQIKEAKEQVQPRTPEEQAAWEKASREKGHRSPAPVVPPPVPPPVSQMAGREPWPGQQKVPLDVMNPEFRSMDSQMLADLMAQQATQPEQGYFGGMGEAIQGLTDRVAGMSGQERAALIAALIGAGLITMGSGGMLAPAGAALVGGAGMAALNQ